MDTDAVTSAVDIALKKLTEQASQAGAHARQQAKMEYEASKEIQKVLQAQEEFSKPIMISSLFGAAGFEPGFVARTLLRQARSRGSASAAVDWLAKVLSTQRAHGIAISTFWGVKPEGSITILDNVDLIPFELLRMSDQKKALVQPVFPRPGVPPFMWNPPTAALVRSLEIDPFLRSPDAELSTKHAINALFDDIRLCLTISGPTTTIPGPAWFQYTDPDLQAAVSGSTTSTRHSEITPLAFVDSDTFHPERFVQLVHAFISLDRNPGLKNRLRTAMQRINQTLLRRSPADKALELAIALEALLVNSPGEHTFKIGLRAALLTSTDVEKRKRNRAIIEGMYGARSSLMHSGQSPDTFKLRHYGKLRTTDIVSEALEITALVVRQIIDKGAIPDWNSLELSSAM